MARAGNALIGALRVSLSADTAQFETGLKRTQAQLTLFERSFGRFSSTLRAGLAGAAGALTVGAVSKAIGALITKYGDLADAAERASVSTDFLQGFGAVARDAGVSMDEVVGMIQKFNIEIGEAAAKGGPLLDQLRANGIAIRDANGELRTTEDLFFDIVDLIGRAESAQEAAFLSQLAFGRSAKEVLAVLRQHPAEIKKGMQAAKESGEVVDAELVKAADEFGDRWATGWARFQGHAATALLTAMRGAETLNKELDDISSRGSSPGLELLKWLGLISDANDLREESKRLEAGIAAAMEEGTLAVAETLKLRLAEVNAQLGVIKSQANSLGPAWERFGRGGGMATSRGPAAVIETDEERRKREEAAKAIEDQKKEVTELIDELKFEQQQLARTALEQEIATNLRKAGATATADQRREIIATTAAAFSYAQDIKEATDLERKALAESARLWEDIGKAIETSVLNVFDSLIDKTFTWRDALADTLRLAASVLANIGSQSVSNAGGWGQLLGFAQGGSFTVGGSGGVDSQLVAFRATPGEQVTIDDGGPMGGFTFAPSTVIDARGSSMSEQKLKTILDARDRAWREALPSQFKQARTRGKV